MRDELARRVRALEVLRVHREREIEVTELVVVDPEAVVRQLLTFTRRYTNYSTPC